MGWKKNRKWNVGMSAVLALSVLVVGCSLPTFAPAAPEEDIAVVPTEAAMPTATEAALATDAPPEPTAEATATTLSASPTTSESVVTISATGNVFIRRGPGLAYNTVSYMQSGQQARAHGRNATGDWLYVERPDLAGSFGWVFQGTYTRVEGDPLSLEVMNAGPAEPAYLRNCTFHPMRILPGDFILAEQFDPTNNVHQVNPGTYEAYDQNVEGDPLVLSPTVREGQTVDIATDGLNNTYACPG